MRPLAVSLIEKEKDFASLHSEWNELLSESKSNGIFLTWEWLHTWWSHLADGRRLFIATVRDGDDLVALAPLTLRGRILEFLGTGTVGSDYLDFIIRTGHESRALGALSSFLAGTGLSLRLSNVEERAAATALLRQEWRANAIPLYVCPFINLSGLSWDSYLASIGSNHRYNFRRRLRQLERDFKVDFGPGELQEVVDLHLQRWSARGGSDAFSDARVVEFHKEMTRVASERGWLRMLALRLDGRAAAVIYGFRYGRVFYFYQSGFDPAFERYSVGLVAMGLAIRSAIEEGAAEYDLLHGDETYKFLWAKESRQLVRLELYAPGVIGLMHQQSRLIITSGKRVARTLLEMAG